MSNNLNFHYSDAKSFQSNNTNENTTQFRLSQFYINNTREDVVVVLRNNLPVFVPKNSAGMSNSQNFIIRTIYNFNNNNSIIETINNITEVNKAYGNDNQDLVIISKVLLDNYNNDRLVSNCKVVIDREVPIARLKTDDVLYVPETDTLLSFRTLNLKYPHPFSRDGQAISEYYQLLTERKVSGVFIEIIDNENNIGNRYMYVAKQLVEIQTRKDVNKKSGVYFTKANNDSFDEIHIQPEFYDFDKAEDYLGLYKTKEEASTGGNPENISKIKLAELQNQLQEAKHIQGLDKIKQEQLVSDLNTEIEKLKAKNIKNKEKTEINKSKRTDFYETRKEKRNDYYDERTHARKDTSEIIKYIPGIVLGIIGAVAYTNSKQ